LLKLQILKKKSQKRKQKKKTKTKNVPITGPCRCGPWRDGYSGWNLHSRLKRGLGAPLNYNRGKLGVSYSPLNAAPIWGAAQGGIPRAGPLGARTIQHFRPASLGLSTGFVQICSDFKFVQISYLFGLKNVQILIFFLIF
jgi:hypothetical protein